MVTAPLSSFTLSQIRRDDAVLHHLSLRDVDEGALYYFAAGDGPFLLGVTLHQNRVFHADLRMNMLCNSVRHLLKEGEGNRN